MRTSLAALCALLPAAALAEADWFASLYTGDGVELRADERVFTLYALLNAMGYDKAPVTRQEPTPKFVFHPVRQDVRQKIAGLDPAVRKQADLFFDAHPKALSHYLSFVVEGPPPPFENAPKAKEAGDLKGFESILHAAYGSWNVAELIAQSQPEYRKALKSYLPVLDGPLGRAKKLLKVSDDSGMILVVNLLDASEEVRSLRSSRGVVVVVGPSEKPNLDGVVREFARVFVDPVVSKKAQAGWPGGPGCLRDAQDRGATEQSVADYASSLFARAIALKATEAPDAAYEAAGQKGYFGLKEISKAFEEGKPLESWAIDALARAETKRPAKK